MKKLQLCKSNEVKSYAIEPEKDHIFKYALDPEPGSGSHIRIILVFPLKPVGNTASLKIEASNKLITINYQIPAFTDELLPCPTLHRRPPHCRSHHLP